MKIILEDAGKRYNRHWVFRHFSYTFQAQSSYAITGPNGSGKTTLLQVISGAVAINEGTCTWYGSNNLIGEEVINSYITLAAPYLELVEEMTALEFLHFHSRFKDFIDAADAENILKETQLYEAADKQIRYYSTGMKQRLKLAQAVFSNIPVVLLDEPCTALDESGIQLYNKLIKKYCAGRLLIISSNDINEYSFCNHIIHIPDYK